MEQFLGRVSCLEEELEIIHEVFPHRQGTNMGSYIYIYIYIYRRGERLSPISLSRSACATHSYLVGHGLVQGDWAGGHGPHSQRRAETSGALGDLSEHSFFVNSERERESG